MPGRDKKQAGRERGMDQGTKVWAFLERIARAVVNGLLRIVGKELNERQWKAFWQFVQFGIVGLSNTIISYVVYLIGISFGLHYLLASIVGFVVSVQNAFYWNNKYVFQAEEGEKRIWWKAWIKTFLSYASTGLVLANILLVLWVDVLHIPEALGPVINLLITIPLNFLMNKLWAFRKKG